MQELSVNITLCDRPYPMKVNAAEEASARKAGKLLNEQIHAYQKRLGLYDKQDSIETAINSPYAPAKGA